jgi:hypothetical protein
MNDYFCYIIHDNTGVPVYVGKGHGRRSRRVNGQRNANIDALISFGGTLSPVKVREGLTESEAYEFEKALIAFHGRDDLGLGPLLNLSDGGAGTPNPSAAHRTALADSARARMSGKKRTPEEIEKLRLFNTGRKKSAETCARISAAKRGKPGKPHTSETIAKMSASQRGARAFSLR